MESSSDRHAETPTQRLTALTMEPLSWLNLCTGVISNLRWPGAMRRPSVTSSGSTSTPGLNSESGSRIFLNWAKNSRISDEYIWSNCVERARPSQCYLDKETSYDVDN